jgi:RHS repeat-associated protein
MTESLNNITSLSFPGSLNFITKYSICQNNKSLTFTYGPDQQRIKTVFTDGVVTKTKSFSSDYEEEVTAAGTRKLHYISSPYGLAAIYIDDGVNPQMYYVLKDHLGSITGLVDQNGNLAEEYSYDAWGKRRNPATGAYLATATNLNYLIDRGYTGHEHLDEFGLINMNGRMYDPFLSRMLSPDNFVQDATSTQTFNRYSYANNNPLKYTDPTGEFAVFIPIIIGVAIGGYSGYQIGKAQGATGAELFGYAFMGGVVGGLAGGIGVGVAGSISAGIGGVGGGIIGTTIGGGVAGGINGFGMAAISGGNVGQGFVNGAISGLAAGAVGAGLGAIAPGFSNASLAGRYAGKALYAGLTGAAAAGAGMFAGDLADNGRIDLKGSDYLRGMGVGAAMGAGISLGYSAYDYATWDRLSPTNKVALLNREFNTSVLQYDPNDPNYGSYSWAVVILHWAMPHLPIELSQEIQLLTSFNTTTIIITD